MIIGEVYFMTCFKVSPLIYGASLDYTYERPVNSIWSELLHKHYGQIVMGFNHTGNAGNAD